MVEKRKRSSSLSAEDKPAHATKSVLKSNDVSFPRGGASVLTPLEVKEVANEAARDVLFESENTKTSDKQQQQPQKKKKKVSSGKKKPSTESTTETEADKATVTIDHFNFKSLSTGSHVLGQVVQINKMDIAMSLTDNIIGYVPITSISEEITTQLQNFEKEQNDEDEDDDENDEDDDEETTVQSAKTTLPKLKQHIKIGSWLRAQVVENQNTSGKARKRIQLTVEPENVNSVLEEEDLIAGTTIQTSIASIEDHGCILNTGMDKNGFISKKELKNGGIDIENLVIGSILLTTIAKDAADARTITCKIPSGNVKKQAAISTVSSIDSLLPGTLVDALITEVQHQGIMTKVFGVIEATINFTHLGIFEYSALKHRYSIGSNIKARVLNTYVKGGEKRVTLSVLPHILSLDAKPYDSTTDSDPLEAFPVGHVFEDVEIKGHDSRYIYADVGNKSTLGQAHISKINENEATDVEYKIGTKHKARIIGYSQLDNLYILTFKKDEIKKPYLRSSDIPVGKRITAEVVKIVSEGGISLKIFDEFDAYVPKMHISDVKLIYPERKFKIGSKYAGRILKITHPKDGKTNIMVTFKKSLVNIEDDEVYSSIDEVEEAKRVPATVEKFTANGCVVTFFGNLRGFLPKAEISETFVRRSEDHLRLGQTVKVRILNVDKENKRIKVSCRAFESLTKSQNEVMKSIVPGQTIVKAVIVQKEKDSLVVEVEDNNLRGIIFAGHLSDKNIEQCRAQFKKLQVGETIPEALVLEKDLRSRALSLTMKESLISDAKENGSIPTTFEDINGNENIMSGFIKSVTESGLFVGFANRLTGLVLPKYYSSDKSFHAHQSVKVKVLKIDAEKKRFLLTMDFKSTSTGESEKAVNPVDSTITSLEQFVPGKITKAIVKSVKATQLNVELADNLQGRIDISQVFENFSEIKDKKHPLSQFKKDDVLDVRVIGYHDVRNHRFLPISHRKNKQLIVELSAKRSDLAAGKSVNPLTLSATAVGTKWTAFVNNFARNYLWVNIAPAIRGRVSLMDLSDDAGSLETLDESFPLGSALQVSVLEVDTEHNALSLTARDKTISSIASLHVGDVLPARVLRTKDTFVLVELGKGVTASAYITDALDNYTDKLENVFSTNDVCVATVLAIDQDNEKVNVSLRTKDAKDQLVSSVDVLQRGDVVRGFVKNISDNGVYVSLGRTVHGLVRVADLSDSYIKEWKKFYKPHQPVICKVINAEEEGRVLLTMKDSEVNGDLSILKNFSDITVGDIFEGSVKQATDFGVFVKLDGTVNISGLCHHTEISNNDVTDVKALFGPGDRVKVKVLKVSPEKKQLSLGMKASYFIENTNDDEEDSDGDVEMDDAESEISEAEVAEEKDVEAAESGDEDDVMEDFDQSGSESSSDDESDDEASTNNGDKPKMTGLSTNGFDWTASILEQAQPEDDSDDEEDFTDSKKSSRKKKKQQIVEDKTADLNTRAPQSVSDFERLLVGNPNSSILWMNYMSFQLQLSELEKAREIADRALNTINYREEQEKLNIWIALLNMENTFGTDESLEDVFKKAVQFMEPNVMYQKVISIYIMSEKFDKADDLFQKSLKKFGKDVSIWVSYGSFLLDQKRPSRCHELLAKALNQLPKSSHIEIVRKFAQLEFQKGEAEQGRSLFEGLLSDAPKRIDLWNVYVDQEIKLATSSDKKKVEELFERVIQVKKLSRKQAKFFFNKWLLFEEEKGDRNACDYVKAKAVEYAEKNTD